MKGNIVVTELFDEIQSMLQTRYMNIIPTKASISFYVEPPDLTIISDYLRIKQILINFITNSMKNTPSGKITYSCRVQNNQAVFKVTDTGRGISESDKKQIFNRFQKFEDKENKFPGTGIGLSICKNLAKLLGGKISFNSKLGKGSEFYLSIPYETSFVKK
jgi:signal transduction histidine kinase